MGTKICSEIIDVASVETEHVIKQLSNNLPLLRRIEITRMNG